MRRKTVQYVGLDVHKEFCQASVLDESGEEVSSIKVLTRKEELESFLDGFEDASFVLESTGIWEFVYEMIERHGFEMVLAHPLKVRAIAEAKVKTDKVDARTLAHLLRADLVPRSYIPSKDLRDLRQLVRQRAYLVQRATSFKNRIHAELLRRGIRRPKELVKSFTHKSVAWMRSLSIPTVNSSLDCLEAIQLQVEQLNEQLLQEFDRRREAQLIATIPGIGFYGALLIWAEIADVNRFPDPEHLCSYAGLTPTVSQSASKSHYGGVSKEGSKYLRWILTESTFIHIMNCPDSRLSHFHARVARRRGKQKATVATARKLLHWMLINGEEYRSQGLDLGAKPAA